MGADEIDCAGMTPTQASRSYLQRAANGRSQADSDVLEILHRDVLPRQRRAAAAGVLVGGAICAFASQLPAQCVVGYLGCLGAGGDGPAANADLCIFQPACT